MSNPDQPSTPPLTRRQLRDIRNTGSTPIQTPPDAPAAEPETTPEPEPKPTPAPVAPLPRAAVPAIVPPAPRADASVDLGVSPLTRRQAREQERIRTASVPVIAPDAVAPAAGESSPFAPRESERPADETPLLTAEAALADEPAPVVSTQLGSALLDGPAPDVTLPASFDHLLTRESTSTGAVMTPNALILSQTPSADAFTSIAATGEVLITGTFPLPEGLGSHGHAPGTTDGKDVDSVLIDGELPAASSPTPIAASAAISTIKSADEIIRPPAPEKGSRLMLALAITAGALALALVAVLIIAVTTGVVS